MWHPGPCFPCLLSRLVWGLSGYMRHPTPPHLWVQCSHLFSQTPNNHCRIWLTIISLPLLSSYNTTKGLPGPLQSYHIKLPNVSLKIGEGEDKAYFQTPGFWHHPERGEASTHQDHLCFQLHITTLGSSHNPLSSLSLILDIVSLWSYWYHDLLYSLSEIIAKFPLSCPFWINLVCILQRTLLW